MPTRYGQYVAAPQKQAEIDALPQAKAERKINKAGESRTKAGEEIKEKVVLFYVHGRIRVI